MKEKAEPLNNQNELEIYIVQEIFLSNTSNIKIFPLLFVFYYTIMEEHLRKFQK